MNAGLRLCIVGGAGGTNIGDSLRRGALREKMNPMFVNSADAFAASALRRRFLWHLCGRRPARLGSFGEQLARAAVRHGAELVITTGIAPVNVAALEQLGKHGIVRINYLTDDPWNTSHRAPWFLAALRHYDMVFSTKRACISDLRNHGCRHADFLPFGYDEDIFTPPAATEIAGPAAQFASDVCFAGGADADRVPYISALTASGIRVGLFGSYWDDYPETRALTRGQLAPSDLRLALIAAKVGLCLVRRANRDGNSMRSFEVPAVGTCMLAERTPEHEEIFGGDGDNVMYFDSKEEMTGKAKHLLREPSLREALARKCLRLVTTGGHTYRHRLLTMIQSARGH